MNRHLESIRIGALKLGGIGDICDYAVILHGIRKRFSNASIVAITDCGKYILQNYADAVIIDNQTDWYELSRKHGWQYDLFYDLRPHSGLVFKGDYWSKTKRFISNNRLGHLDERVDVDVTLQHIERFNHYNSIYTNKLQDKGKTVIELNCDAIGIKSTYDEARLDVPDKLPDGDFITINTGAMGAEKGKRQTKQWDMANWQAVVDMLLGSGERVVQLGIRWEKKLKRVEHVWQKPLSQVMQYLEASKLHLGNENGLVRLRRLLTKKPSIVLFGPTHPDMYGFRSNINLWGNVCKPCLWATGDWMTKCALGLNGLCMDSISTNFILERCNEQCN
jgi:ADP-heptose:LPS heptosyltransferase